MAKESLPPDYSAQIEPRRFSRREFLRLMTLPFVAGLGFKCSSALADQPEYRIFLPLIIKTPEEIITKDQNRAFYNGLKAMRAQGIDIVGDNTGEWGMYYTKSTNIGLDLISTIVAEKKELISQNEAREHILEVLKLLEPLKTYKGILPEFIKIEGERIFAEEKNGVIRYSSIDSGWLTMALSIVRDYYKSAEISDLADEMINKQDYSVFMNARGLMGAGFEVDVNTGRIIKDFGFSYDNKNSEARVVVLSLVGMGKLPGQTWNNMFYCWTEKEGLQIAEGWHFSAFVELTGNIFFNEMKLAPDSFGRSHSNYVTATYKIAGEKGYKIFGWAPCTDPQGGYREYGLDNNSVVSPYAAALLATTDDVQTQTNLLEVIKLSANGEAPLPDALDSKTGKVLNSKALTLDQALFFLAVNNDVVREIVNKTQWYEDAEKRIKEFDTSLP